MKHLTFMGLRRCRSISLRLAGSSRYSEEPVPFSQEQKQKQEQKNLDKIEGVRSVTIHLRPGLYGNESRALVPFDNRAIIIIINILVS